MVYSFCFEALDKTLKDIFQFNNQKSHSIPIGSKTIVFTSDLKQILHVIQREYCTDIVYETLNFSYLEDS